MSGDRIPTVFTLSFSRWMRIITAPMLSGPEHCAATITPDRLDVRMGTGGWAFAASVHRSSLVDVRQVNRAVWGWGAHGWRNLAPAATAASTSNVSSTWRPGAINMSSVPATHFLTPGYLGRPTIAT
ncbi:MAG TPA: hypothetical protein VIH06_13615 [Ilumatobacteraceae bacterium]